MKATHSSSHGKSSLWLTLTGVILALLLCLVATSMVLVVYPQSSTFLASILSDGEKLIALDQGGLFQAAQPTPFQPGPAYTPMPTPIVQPTPQPPSGPVAYAPEAAQNQPADAGAPPTVADLSNNDLDLPMSSYVNGLKGTAQLYTLDCEAQASVNWAKFYGVDINELEFIDNMPRSDDPESGFVGNINGPMGQLPPNDYGIHAAPIAEMLKGYGLPAKAKRNWTLSGLKAEIAAGQPVIVWIVNMPFEIDAQEYTASNGNTTTVARFEHTWIVTGYNSTTVTVVDSEWTYNVNINTFLDRWEALGKQAVIYTGD
ncbi:MAG: hypothetical protein PWQ55_2062 [Chloroflexota bacterium]|nr:hypothetical protein [Chloroflexota bacterium]